MASKRVVIVAIDGSDHAYDALDCEYIVSHLKRLHLIIRFTS